MSCPEVAIIILNWNGLNDTAECVESLKKLNYENYKVIVVDNGSAGNDVQTLRERFGDYVHIIENDKNYGFAEGNNIGIRYALTTLSPDYVLLLNNDTVVDPEMLTELVKAAESDVNIVLVGPKIYPYTGINTRSPEENIIDQRNLHPLLLTLIDTFELSLLCNTVLQSEIPQAYLGAFWLKGCALLMKTTVIEKMGLLYSGYFAFYEETEYCFRCLKAGFTLIEVPTALLWHKGGATAAKVPGLAFYLTTRNQFLFVARNSNMRGLLRYFGYFVFFRGPLTAYYYIFRNDLKSLGIFCRAVFDGIRYVITKQS